MFASQPTTFEAKSAEAIPDPNHTAVRDVIIAAMNDFPSAPPKLLALLDDDADWCDPYPSCRHGRANISAFLHSMPMNTHAVLLAEPMVTVGPVGGMMTTLSFSWPGNATSCLYTADQHVSWNLSNSIRSRQMGNSTAAAPTPTLSWVRWVYNASEFELAISGCLGPAAAVQRLIRGTGEAGRDAELQAVKEYVVGLQYSLAAQALICDLLVPTARYCDPFPLRCAFGRTGCRAMKGLPPFNQTDDPTDVVTPTTAFEAKPAVGPYLCKPASVRPLLPSGATTGAVYIAYSSTRRTGLQISHQLHHTWAIWQLAPPNASHASPAPMLASFDWFMPDHNVR
jgi:hypothetical protein